MGTPRFTPEFKEEAVRQIMERGDSVAKVSNRRGVPAHSLYKWLRAWGQSIFRAIRVNEKMHTVAIGQLILFVRWHSCSDFDIF